MNSIQILAQRFRKAMDEANRAGDFSDITAFKCFPRGSCQDTCILLSEYLLEHGICTAYVRGEKYPEQDAWGEKNAQSHAWLAVVSESDFDYKEKRNVIISTNYESWLHNRTIIDITGDQFSDDSDLLNYDKTVYVGKADDFHKLFCINSVHESSGLEDCNFYNEDYLNRLYGILKHILCILMSK